MFRKRESEFGEEPVGVGDYSTSSKMNRKNGGTKVNKETTEKIKKLKLKKIRESNDS